MADYYSIIAKAVSTLDPNTEGARRRLYERARSAVIAEMHRAEPALDHSDIMAAQMSLELAIGEVEADAQREQHAQTVPSGPSYRRNGALSKPSFPANENDQQGRGPLTRLWAQFSRRADESVEDGAEGDCWEGRDTWLTELCPCFARGGRTISEFRAEGPGETQRAGLTCPCRSLARLPV
jgi:hypothetical protein